MKAVVLEGQDQIAVRDLPEPIAEQKALVRVERAGLCGTDLKIVSGAIPTQPPLVLGHEVIGRVVRSGTESLVPAGTRVLLDPGIACRHCADCRNDREYLCSHGALMGRDTNGGFAEFLEVHEYQLHPLPAGIDPDAEVVLQVLATCVHAQSRISVFPGQAAAVLGLGVSGLLHAQLLRLRGAHPVIGVTRSGAKREMAQRLGVHHAFTPSEATEEIRRLTGGRGADVVVESAGSADSFRQSSSLAAPGGTVLVFGTISPNADDVPTYDWYYKELDVVNSRAARSRDYARAIELAAAGMVDLAPIVTSTYPLNDAVKAFAACGQPSELKVVLEVA